MKNSCIPRFYFVLILLLFSCRSFQSQAQAKNYGAVLNFTSACCGTPNGDKIFSFIKVFRGKYNIPKIKAIVAGPLGKEGEHAYLLKLNELTKTQKVNFLKGLKRVVGTYRSDNPSDGSIGLSEDQAIKTWEKEIQQRKIEVRTVLL